MLTLKAIRVHLGGTVIVLTASLTYSVCNSSSALPIHTPMVPPQLFLQSLLLASYEGQLPFCNT